VKLLSPKGMDVRPMMEVVKGAAFDILQVPVSCLSPMHHTCSFANYVQFCCSRFPVYANNFIFNTKAAGGCPAALRPGRWLDLYSGTGSVGIEALSRGCSEVLMFSVTSLLHAL